MNFYFIRSRLIHFICQSAWMIYVSAQWIVMNEILLFIWCRRSVVVPDLKTFEFMRISLAFTRRLILLVIGEQRTFHVPSKPINLSDCLPSSPCISCFSLFSNIINKKLDGFSLLEPPIVGYGEWRRIYVSIDWLSHRFPPASPMKC